MDDNLIQLSNMFFEPFNGDLLIIALFLSFWFRFYAGFGHYAGFSFWFGWRSLWLGFVLSGVHGHCIGQVIVFGLINLFQSFLYLFLQFGFGLIVDSAGSSDLNQIFLLTDPIGYHLKVIQRSFRNAFFSGSTLLVVILPWWGIELGPCVCFEELFLLGCPL